MNALLKVIISMIIWGSVGLFVKNIDLPSMEIVFLRSAIASIFLIVYGFIISVKNKSKNEFKVVDNSQKRTIYYLIGSGAALALNWILLFQAYRFTTISTATLSYYFAPVFVILASPFILKEKFTKSKFLAVIGALIGLSFILVSQPTAYNSSYNHVKGIMFGLTAAIFYAAVVLLNKYIKDLSGYQMTVIQISTAALVLLPFVIYRNNLHIYNSKTVIFVLIIGVMHTGIPYLMYISAIKDLKAQNVAIVSYIDPISAVIFSAIFFGETMTVLQILGGSLILISTFLGNRDKKPSVQKSY